MGRRHIQIVKDGGFELVGVYDQSKEALNLAAAECALPSSSLFDNAGELFGQTGPDCVIVATTAPAHCLYTCMAAEHGARYILCEKPMATSLAQCDRMLEICAKRGIALAVNHQMRYMEQYTEPKRLLQSERFGGLCSIVAAGGNFGLAMNGSHYFEALRYVSNDWPEEVTAWLSKEKIANPRGPQFEDPGGSLRILTKNGCRFFLEAGTEQGHGLKVIYNARLGQIVVDELAGEMTLTFREESQRALPTTRYSAPWLSESRKIARVSSMTPTQAVLAGLLSERDYPTGEEGRSAVATLVAAYVSDETGNKPIHLSSGELPREREFSWA